MNKEVQATLRKTTRYLGREPRTKISGNVSIDYKWVRCGWEFAYGIVIVLV